MKKRIMMGLCALSIVFSTAMPVCAQTTEVGIEDTSIVTESDDVEEATEETEVVDETESADGPQGEVAEFKAVRDFQKNKSVKDAAAVKQVKALGLPNQLGGALTPTSTGFTITLLNYGVDKISTCTMNIKIYSNGGKLLKSASKTVRNIKVGTSQVTWAIPKTATVQETVKLSGTARDGGETFVFNTSTYRYNFVGGKYSAIKALDGERHHMPSNSVSPLSTGNGPCIRMVKADHRKTASVGNTISAQNFRAKEKKLIKEGKFLGAQNLGIQDVRKLFSSKYNGAINQMVSYTKSLGYKK